MRAEFMFLELRDFFEFKLLKHLVKLCIGIVPKHHSGRASPPATFVQKKGF
jgi:hypothetical protein